MKIAMTSMSLWRSDGNLHMLNSSAGNYMWSSKSLAFPPEIILEDMEVTWIVLGIKLSNTCSTLHPPREEEIEKYGERYDQGVWRWKNVAIWYSYRKEKGTREKCHWKPIKNICLTYLNLLMLFYHLIIIKCI